AYFEDYGLKNYANNPQWFAPQPHGWAYWQSQGFSKLLDFWDRGKFINGSSDALNQEAAGTLKLGLAEFSNGNFLGEDALYAEYFDSSDIHYFPFPSLWTSTTFSDLKNSLAPYADVSFLKNGRPINRFYIEKRKDADGIFVKHHSALLYLGIQGAGQNTGKDQLKVSSTIHDPTVLQDYHSILIPKAVEYSTGILDYFFRGKFVTSDPTPYGSSQFQVQVSNESGQDLKGGTFHLFWDDSTGNRSELTGSDFSTTYSGALAAGGTITVTFTPPVNAVRYTLVYQGTIGTSGGTALDPVDDGIAVIAARLHSCNNVQDLDWTIDEQQDLGTSVNVDMSGGDGSFDLTGSWGNDPCNGVPNAWADISADVCNVTDPAYDITVTVDYSGTPEQTVSCNDPYTGPWTLVDGLYLTIYVDGDLVANAGLIGDGYPLTGQLSTVVHLDVGSSHHIAIGPEAEGLGRLTGTITIRPLVHP
ncbi:MAG: hypothetical protein KGJ60_03485, partial [Verrucomicrobiota bacterium]|nr:hypothetical protein [Verrucomicrobiota bacterium]